MMKSFKFEPAVFFEKALQQKKMIMAGMVAIGIVLARQYFEWSVMSTLILGGFVGAVMWQVASRIFATFALVFLVSCPALLIVGKEEWAEMMAVQAYYLLVVTVILQIIELKRPEKIDLLEKGWQVMLAQGNKLLLSKALKVIKKKAQVQEEKEIRWIFTKKTITYILIVAFLILELAVVFFEWSLGWSGAVYLALIVGFFPKKAKHILLATTMGIVLFSLGALIFSQEDIAKTLYLWAFVSGGLWLWSLAGDFLTDRFSVIDTSRKK